MVSKDQTVQNVHRVETAGTQKKQRPYGPISSQLLARKVRHAFDTNFPGGVFFISGNIYQN